MTLRTKGFLLIGAIIVLSLGLSGYYHLHFLESSLRQSIYEGLEAVNRSQREMISHFLRESRTSAQTAALAIESESIRTRNVAELETQLAAVSRIVTRFDNGMFILDAQGYLLADYPAHPDLRGQNFAFRQYYQATLAASRGIIGRPYISRRTQQPVLTFTAPFRDQNGEILGMLCCSAQLTSPSALEGIRQTTIGQSGYIYLYDTSRLMILHPQNDRILKRDVPPGANRLFDAALEGFQGVGETVNSRGVGMLAAFTRVPETDWILAAQQPVGEALAPIAAARNRWLMALAAAVLIALAVTAAAIGRITGPLERLRKAALTLGQPDGADRAADSLPLNRFKGTREIEELARTLQEIYTQLTQANSARLQAAEEKLQLEQQLKRAQKMEAIGTLAGGIAHDFNNILSAVIGYTEIALEDLPPDHETAENLEEVLKAGRRAKALVRQILTFSRQSEPAFKPVRIDHIVEEALKLIRASLPSTLAIHQDIRSAATVLADATQIHQVILNLATNAAQAMENEGGELRVTLKEIRSSDFTATVGNRLSPGRYLKLTLADTGGGIPKDLQERIFDPFFTTKDRQHGTGMGLAVVHGIITSHRGGITLTSRPGAGTRFDIYLPVAGLDEARPPPVPARGKGGSEHILLIDDEPTITDMMAHILEHLGYRVTALNESPEALEAFRREPQTFDLVITDMTMPRLTGDRLAAEMLALRPELPVILCTGYSKEITDARIREIGIRRLIYKPVEMNELARIIRRTLDAPPGDPKASPPSG